jgi:hypothetical protein
MKDGKLAEHWDVLQDEATQAESRANAEGTQCVACFASNYGVLR